jgi:hypothetical protein
VDYVGKTVDKDVDVDRLSLGIAAPPVSAVFGTLAASTQPDSALALKSVGSLSAIARRSRAARGLARNMEYDWH